MKHYGKPPDWLVESGEFPARGNVLPVVLGLIAIGVAFCAMWAFGSADDGGPGESLSPCILIGDDHARLACYDQIATLPPPAKGAFAPTHNYRKGSQ